jgi:hypothetical protein
MRNIINNKKNNEMLVELMGKNDELRKRVKEVQDEMTELFERFLSCEDQSETNLEKFLNDNRGKMINWIINIRKINNKLKIFNIQLDGFISIQNLQLKENLF